MKKRHSSQCNSACTRVQYLLAMAMDFPDSDLRWVLAEFQRTASHARSYWGRYNARVRQYILQHADMECLARIGSWKDKGSVVASTIASSFWLASFSLLCYYLYHLDYFVLLFVFGDCSRARGVLLRFRPR